MSSLFWSRWIRSRSARRSGKGSSSRSVRPSIESLETRINPVTNTWTGLGSTNNWSDGANWSRGAPAPGDGNDLLFPAGAPQRNSINDIPNLNPTFIAFSGPNGGSGYTLSGPNAITLGSASDATTINVNAGSLNNVITFDVRASGAGKQTVNVGANASLRLDGHLEDAGAAGPFAEIVKAGTGTLTLGGDNNDVLGGHVFSGKITVSTSGGVLVIEHENALGNTVGNTTVQSNAELQIAVVPAGPGVATIAENFVISGTGVTAVGAIHQTVGTATLTGTVQLASTTTGIGSEANAELTIEGQISDTVVSNLTINNGSTAQGEIIFARVGGNTYRGRTTINNGILTIRDPLSLGPVALPSASAVTLEAQGTIVNTSPTQGAGTLRLENAGIVLNEQLTLNGSGFSGQGALHNALGDNVWGGPVLLGSIATPATNATIRTDNDLTDPANPVTQSLLISGVVQDPNLVLPLIKTGAGTLIFNNANTYRGSTSITAGILNIRDSLALGAVGSSTTSITSGAALELEVDSGPDTFRSSTVAGFGAGTQQPGRVSSDLADDSITGQTGNGPQLGLWVRETLTVNGTGLNNGVNNASTGALRSKSGINYVTIPLTIGGGNAAIGVDDDDDDALVDVPAFSNSNNYFTNDYSLTVGTAEVQQFTVVASSGFTVDFGGFIATLGPNATAQQVQNALNALTSTINANGFFNVSRTTAGPNATFVVTFGRAMVGLDLPDLVVTQGVTTPPVTTNTQGGLSTINGTTANLRKAGGGHLILPNRNDYTTTTSIDRGWVTIRNNNSLGAPLPPPTGDTAQPTTTVISGAALHLKPLIPDQPINLVENLILAGSGITHNFALIDGKGALMSLGGVNTIGGRPGDPRTSDVTIQGQTGIGVELLGPDVRSELTITGTISETIPPPINVSGNAQGNNLQNARRIDVGATAGTITLTPDVYGAEDDVRVYLGDFINDPANAVLVYDASGDYVSAQPTPINQGAAIITINYSNTQSTASAVLIPSNPPFGMATSQNYDGVVTPVITNYPTLSSTFVTIVVNPGNNPIPGITQWEYTAQIQANNNAARGGITKFGSRRLTLQGDSTFTGDVNIPEGVLVVQHDDALGPNPNATSTNTGTTPGLIHAYQLNGNYNDDLGGPPLTPFGPTGVLSATNYRFLDADGLTLPRTALPNGANYSIEMIFSFDDLTSYVNILQFKDSAQDEGLYNLNGALQFYGVNGTLTPTGPAGAFTAGVNVTLLFTRDGTTGEVVAYINGIEQFRFIDAAGDAIFDQTLINFFVDDTQIPNEESPGFVDRIRLFDRPLTPNDLVVLTGTPTFAETIVGGGIQEVQTITVAGSATGSYTLTFQGETTGTTFTPNSTADQIETALNLLPSVVRSGGAIQVNQTGNVYQFVFGGSFAGLDQPELVANPAGGTTVVVRTLLDGNGAALMLMNSVAYTSGGITGGLGIWDETLVLGGRGFSDAEEQLVTITNNTLGSVFTLTFNGQTTPNIPFDAPADVVQDALNNLTSVRDVGGSVSVAKTGANYVVRFTGAFLGRNLPEMTATGTGLTAAVSLLVDGGRVESLSIPVGDHLWHGPLTLAGLPVAEQQLLTMTGTSGDTFNLTFNGVTTATPLSFDATAAEVENALFNLSSVRNVGGTVQVAKDSRIAGKPIYTITFGGSLVGLNLPLLVATPVVGTPTLTVLPRNEGRDGSFISVQPSTRLSFGQQVTDAPVAEVQTVTVTGNTGTFQLTFEGSTTGAISATAAASVVAQALNLLPSVISTGGTIFVSESITNAGKVFTITFGNPGDENDNLVGLNLLPLTVSNVSPGLAVNVATRANGAPGSDVHVVGGGQIAFQGQNSYVGSTFVDEGVMVIENSLALGSTGASEVQRVTVTDPTGNGTFRLTFEGQTTPAFTFGAAPSVVEAALNQLSSIGGLTGGSVTVTRQQTGNGPNTTYTYEVTFTGSLLGYNLSELIPTGMTGTLNVSVSARIDGAGGTEVADGASLQMKGSLNVNEPLLIIGQGAATVSNAPLRWFQTGPAPITTPSTLTDQQNPGAQNNTGRITSVVVDPSDADVIYVATAGGGAWKTENGGQTWLPLFDLRGGTPEMQQVSVPVVSASGTFTLSVNEVQTVTVTGATGTYTLTVNGQTTTSLPATATAQDVQDALNTALTGSTTGPASVTALQIPGGQVFTVTFGGALTGVNVPEMIATPSAPPTPGPRVLVTTLTNGGTTAPLAASSLADAGATAGQIQTELNRLSGLGGAFGTVTVVKTGGGNSPTDYTITFQGNLTNRDVPQLIITGVTGSLVATPPTVTTSIPGVRPEGSPETQKLILPVGAGMFTLTLDGEITGMLDGASPTLETDIETELNLLNTISSRNGRVNVTTIPGTGVFTITFLDNVPGIEGLQGVNVNQITTSLGSLTTTFEGTYNHNYLVAGALTILPSDPRVMYLGTGEARMPASGGTGQTFDGFYGTGVYKTTDGGKTWRLLIDDSPVGLGADRIRRYDGVSNPLYGQAVTKIAIDPLDQDVIYVASSTMVVNQPDLAIPAVPGIYRYDPNQPTAKWYNLTSVVSGGRADLTNMSSKQGTGLPNAASPQTPGPEDDFRYTFPQVTATWSDVQVVLTTVENFGAGPQDVPLVDRVVYAALGEYVASGIDAGNPATTSAANPTNVNNWSAVFRLEMDVDNVGFVDSDTDPVWFVGNPAAPTSEIQTLTLDNFSNANSATGTYFLRFNGQDTITLNSLNDLAGQIEAALDALPAIQAVGGVTVTGPVQNNFQRVYTINFAATPPVNQPQIEAFRIQPGPQNLMVSTATTRQGGSADDRANTFPPGAAGDIKLQVFGASIRDNVNVIASITNRSAGGAATLKTLARSTNGGEGWATFAPAGLANYVGNQGYYSNALFAVNTSEIYVGGFENNNTTHASSIYRVTGITTPPGTATDISVVNNLGPGRSIHNLTRDSQGRILAATDAGLWRYDPVANAWTNLNGNLSITQLNSIALDPNDPRIVFGSGRYNGLSMFTDAKAWTLVDTDDSGQVEVNPNNSAVVYHIKASPNQTNLTFTLRRSDAGGAAGTWIDILSIPFTRYAPFVVDPIDPNRLVVGADFPGTALQESFNNGNSWVPLNVNLPLGYSVTALGISSFQGVFVPDFGGQGFTNVQDKGSSQYDPDTIYVTNGSSILVTKDHAVTWRDRTAGLPTNNLSGIVVDPTNRDTVYVTRNVYDEGVGKVFRTTSAGRGSTNAWVDITYNLPNIPVYKLVLDSRTGNLYIGTESGVWRLQPGSTTWERFGLGLENVQVHDLRLNPTTNRLVAGTYGRSVHELFLEDGQQGGGALRAVTGSTLWTGKVRLQTATADVTGVSVTSNVATVTTAEPHHYNVGETVILSGLANNAFNAPQLITAVTDTTFSFALTAADLPFTVDSGTVRRSVERVVISANGTQALPGTGVAAASVEFGNSINDGDTIQAVSSVARTTGVVTVTTAFTHDFLVGQIVTIAGLTGSVAAFNGNFQITAVTGTTFSFALAGADVAPTTVTGTAHVAPELVKQGEGDVILSGANFYGGITRIQEGALVVRNTNALGLPTAETIVEPTTPDGAALELASDLQSEPVILFGHGITPEFDGHNTGALRNVANNNTYTGPLTLATDTTIGVDVGSTLTIGTKAGLTGTGTISGPLANDLSKESAGTLILNSNNAGFQGHFFIDVGVVTVQNSGALGTVGTSGTDVRNQAQLQLDANSTAAVSGATRAANVVTATTTAAHGLSVGDTVILTGFADASFNGTFVVATVPTATTFTFAQTAADATTGAGTARESLVILSESLNVTGSGPQGAGAVQGTGAVLNVRGDNVWRDVVANTHPITLDYITGFLPGTRPPLKTPESVSVAVGVAGGSTLTIDATIGQDTTGAPVTNFGIDKINTGKLIFLRDNTYTGITDVREGILNVQSGGALGLPGLPSTGTLVHDYEFNGNFADSLGGPSLVPTGGFISGGRYVFDTPLAGLSLSNPLIGPGNYSIELVFELDDVSPVFPPSTPANSGPADGWVTLIDFKDRTEDEALVNMDGDFQFFNTALVTNGVFSNNVDTNVLITRDGITGEVVGYASGTEVFRFDDPSGFGVFSAAANIINFFHDNLTGPFPGEEVTGSVDRIRIWNQPLTAALALDAATGGTGQLPFSGTVPSGTIVQAAAALEVEHATGITIPNEELTLNGGGIREVQTVNVIGSTGNFQLSYDGATTANLTTAVTATQLQNALNNLPTISGRYNVNQYSLTNNVVTVRTSVNHSFEVGQMITIAGLPNDYNGTFRITGVTANTLRYTLVHANVATTNVTGATASGEAGSVAVTAVGGGVFQVAFAGRLAIEDPLPLVKTGPANVTVGTLQDGGAGALRNVSGNNAWGGIVNLNTDTSIGADAGTTIDVGGDTFAVTTIALTGNVATLTTAAPHTFTVGQTVLVAGLANSAFNGLHQISGVTANTIRFGLAGTDLAATPDSGTINSGVISDPALATVPAPSFTKVNTGTVVFSGSNLYSGHTEVAEGILTVQNDTALGQGAPEQQRLTLLGGAGTFTLTFNGQTTISIDLASATRRADIENALLNLSTIGKSTFSVDQVSRTAGVSTLRTTTNHTFSPGQFVVIRGLVTNFTFNGTYQITGVTANTISFMQVGAVDVAAATENATAAVGGIYVVEAPAPNQNIYFINFQNAPDALDLHLDNQNQITSTPTPGVTATMTTLRDGPEGTVVRSGATLQVQGGVTVGNRDGRGDYLSPSEALTLYGDGFVIMGSALGALNNVGGDNEWMRSIVLGSDVLLGSQAGSLNLSGVITDLGNNFTATKIGAGTIEYSAANVYTGLTTVNEGTLLLSHVTETAAVTNAARTSNVATLTTMLPHFFDVGQVVEVAGLAGAAAALNGTFTITAVTEYTFSYVTTTSGTVAPASVTGTATVENAIRGNLTVGDTVTGAAIAMLGADEQIPDTATVRVNSDGTFDLDGFDETIDALIIALGAVTSGAGGELTVNSVDQTAGSITLETAASRLNLLGNVTVTSDATGGPAVITGDGAVSLEGASRTFTVGGPSVIDLVFSAGAVDDLASGTASLIKTGPGRMQITNAVTTGEYAVPTTVNNGDLQVDGVIADVFLTNVAATLSGTGRVESIQGTSPAVGTVNPGQNGTPATRFGRLTVGNPATAAQTDSMFGSGTTFFVDLNDDGAGAGTGYDQLIVDGVTLDVTDAVLSGLATANVTDGDTFTIIQAVNGGQITGTFEELFDANEVYISGQKFNVIYNRGPNGSVVLTRALADVTVDLVSVLTDLTTAGNPSVFGQPVFFVATITPEDAARFVGTPPQVTFTIDVDGGPGTDLRVFVVNATQIGTSSSWRATFDPQTALGAPLNLGSHLVTADFLGDANVEAGQDQLTQVVNQSPTTTTIVLSPDNPPDAPVFGQTIAFTTTVAAAQLPNIGTPTGMVSFTLVGPGGPVTLTPSTYTLNAMGQVMFNVSGLGVGQYTLTASYSGDTNYVGTPPQPATSRVFNVFEAFATVTVTGNPTSTATTPVFGQQVTFTATVTATAPATGTPAGTVSFFDDLNADGDVDPGEPQIGTTQTLVGGVASVSTSGLSRATHSILAVYDGSTDPNFRNGAGSLSYAINRADTTVTITVPPPAQINLPGQAFTVSALVQAVAPGAGIPTGTVSFRFNGGPARPATLNAAGIATLTVNDLDAGVYTVTATYDGNTTPGQDNFNTSVTQAPLPTVTVTQAATTTSVVTSANPPSVPVNTTPRIPVTFTATVTRQSGATLPLTGTVTFVAQNKATGAITALGAPVAVNAAGVASVTTGSGGVPHLPFAEYVIIATYNATTNYATSTGIVDQTFTQFGSATTIDPLPQTLVNGQAFAITVRVVGTGAGSAGQVPNGGTVTLIIDGATGPTVAVGPGGIATFNPVALGAGPHQIRAVFSGQTSRFSPSTSVVATTTVGAAPTAVTSITAPGPITVHRPVTITATVAAVAPGSGVPTGTVVFTIDGAVVGQAAVNAAGQATITYSPRIPAGTLNLVATYTGSAAFQASSASTGLTVTPYADQIYAVGAGLGSIPAVKVYDALTGAERFSFFAYDTTYVGGVRVAVADVTGDGFSDVICGTTPGAAGGHVVVFDGVTGQRVRSFFSIPGFTNGIFVGGGDVDGDGFADIMVGTDAGVQGRILIFSGRTGAMLSDNTNVFANFAGGVRVAGGDVDGDGFADVIAGSGFGSTPHVKVFSGQGNALIRSFFAYDASFRGGVFVAAGNLNGDRFADIITGAGAIPHVKGFDGSNANLAPLNGILTSFIALDRTGGSLTGGPIGAVDRTGDGITELLVTFAGAPTSQLRTLDPFSAAVLNTIFVFPGFRGDIFVG